ncbi:MULTISPECIES: hypothetical protein [Klebsiella]|uniref:Immunity protein n=1 Tax=Klebsiella spallanzanii TaxID=2587528 RepID=A0A564HEB1_9ENTR|nr:MULTISPECIES: hypothetical protein [Klebsiella]MDM4206706.1 hypothetical protein [Klebsiella spallanzanii]WEJ90905.1 MAG: hypothetical protein P0Y63_07760 [Klebsiella huaxiensis]VUS30393.1 hypothetical protein SB6408_00293 [Klebsiella spallanzanii]
MIDFERMVAEQTLVDIILFLVRNENGFGYPQMDRFFSRYKFSVIENGEFMKTFEQMRQKGVVEWGEKMLVKKGPNWKEPKFVTEKKYGIE